MHFTFGGAVKWTGLKRAREQLKRVLPGIGSQAYLVLWLGIFWISDEMEKNDRNSPYAYIFMDTLDFMGMPNSELCSNWSLGLILDIGV